ncbi:MAG: glycosyltransferase family 39 protein [Bacteroidales bacterium]|nr:glycosyltransferase family 39 protein [Bacteroidales bacterium]HNW48159.1 glycosyltransferase family 39 protein [Bacteroidales bacterium]
MKISKENESLLKRYLFILIGVSALVRALIAYFLDLGNNEAYYWTYGLYPDMSHLDHPPMIGWFIQLFTVNLYFKGEIFLRLASIVIGSLNTWIIFILGRRIKNELTGFYAAILYTASIYCSVFVGTFINPDTPQSLFYLLSIYFLHEGLIVKYEVCNESKILCRLSLVLAGLFIGLALLSKYSSIFLWAGVGVYVLSSDRKMLKEPFLYVAAAVSLLFLFPVLYWNYTNGFASFSFQGARLLSAENGINLKFLIGEVTGAFIYNNPVNIIITIAAIFSFKKRRFLSNSQYGLLLSLALPIIFFFLIVSLFTHTMPHWSAPGYFTLILISAAYLASKYEIQKKGTKGIILPSPLKYSLSLLIIATALGLAQYYTGFLNIELKQEKEYKIGSTDFTLENYGWDKLADEFNILRESDIASGKMTANTFILSSLWSDASHYDYYIASPNNMVVKTIGPLNETRKYAWITDKLGSFKIGESAYYIESSRDKQSMTEVGKRYFKHVELAKIIYIKRLNQPVLRFKIFRFKQLSMIPERELCSFTK